MGESRVNDEAEARVQAHLREGDAGAATTVIVEAYGPEILGFLIARMRDETAGSDAFAMFCEDVWRGIERFGWRCSARVWCYTLARNAANRLAVRAHRKPERNLSISKAGGAWEAVQRVRSTTLPHLRTENKDRIRALREQLEVDDQALLILRVDKGMAWQDIVRVMHDEGDVEGDELKKLAARYRKRFQTAKERLRELAVADGLVRPRS